MLIVEVNKELNRPNKTVVSDKACFMKLLFSKIIYILENNTWIIVVSLSDENTSKILLKFNKEVSKTIILPLIYESKIIEKIKYW